MTQPEPYPQQRTDRFRLQAQAAQMQEEGIRVPDDFGTAAWLMPQEQSANAPKMRWGMTGAEWLLLAGVTLLFVSMAITIAQGTGLVDSGRMALIALVPLVGVAAVLMWLGRWAPLLWRYRILGILWGGGAAVAVAVVVNSALFQDLLYYTGDPFYSELVTSVVVAPLSEELAKGLGTLFILVVARDRVSSVLTGAVLGGLVGAGFAFVENIQYFASAMSESSATLGITVFMRGVLSPFVHSMASSLLGMLIAFAILRGGKAWAWTWRLVVGYILAVLIHAMWNGFASLGVIWLLLYVLVEMPLFVGWLVGLILVKNRQLRRIYEGLSAYVGARWLSEGEARMVSYPPARRYASKWARSVGSPAPKRLRQFLSNGGHLGLDQVTMVNGVPTEGRIDMDRQYLQEMIQLRQEFAVLEAAHWATNTQRKGPHRSRNSQGPGAHQ